MRRSLLALSLVVLVAGVVVSLAAGGSGSGSAGRWVIRDLTPGVSVYSSVVAINERGQVLVDVDVGGRIFVWSAGRSRDVRGLSFPSDINERGQVTGRVRAGGDLHAALWDSGRIRDLGTLGGKDSAAVALNDRAQVIGESETRIEDADGYVIERAFLWEEGKMRDLGVLDSVATAINERGQVVGRTLSGRGWSWQNGRMVVLKASRPVGLNEWGQVVANAARENGPVVIWERGSQRVLATLTEHYGCEAAAINEQGQVAGLCGVSGGRARPVIWQRDGTIRELGVVWGDRGQAKVSRVKKLAGFRAGLT